MKFTKNYRSRKGPEGPFFLLLVVVTASMFTLTSTGEGRNLLQITDNAGGTIDVRAVTCRACSQRMLVDIPTIVADSGNHIEAEVVDPSHCHAAQQGIPLVRLQQFTHVGMQSRATIKVLNHVTIIQHDLIQQRDFLILYSIKVAVVALTWREDTCLLVPQSVLNT